eukprot:TRINITY_DN67759_c5_g10_i1.p1 TRINITY_DN67759_c5_g10~~TRINITY_DN67759_c5_g10_i1.p1  ORF type:complete len:315 (+),score=45.75 TRINITY_DN67759_c5_g10_i1:23-967(+)
MLRRSVRGGRALLCAGLSTPVRDYCEDDPVRCSKAWDLFDQQRQDIIVATPYKTGTTWTQQTCRQLLLNGAPVNKWFPDTPFPDSLSMWVDINLPFLGSFEDRAKGYDAHEGRRVFKTHFHFQGIPYHSHWRYVVVLRDPRDVYLSWQDHFRDMAPEIIQIALDGLGKTVDDLPKTPDQNLEAFLGKRFNPFWDFWDWSLSYWKYRHLPNVKFFHYHDLSTDFLKQAKSMAEFTQISPAPTNWDAITEHCSFKYMKQHEVDFQPPAEAHKPGAFINKGVDGRYHKEMSEAYAAAIAAHAHEVLGTEFADWLLRS